ncbi:MAG: terminase small subunit [Rhodospirillales bacterium]
MPPIPRPPRLQPRQERFCRIYLECANAAQAARAAGYCPRSARNTGYRLLRQPRVAARIAALQLEMADDSCRNIAILLSKLETVYRRAIEDHNFAAAARAVELQARLAGVGDRKWAGGRTPLTPDPDTD